MRRLAVFAFAATLAAPALAEEGPAACEAYALEFLKEQGAQIKSVKIETDSLIINRFDANVGSQRVSTEHIGWADAVWTDRTSRERFVCLDAGFGKPVYFAFIPLD